MRKDALLPLLVSLINRNRDVSNSGKFTDILIKIGLLQKA